MVSLTLDKRRGVDDRDVALARRPRFAEGGGSRDVAGTLLYSSTGKGEVQRLDVLLVFLLVRTSAVQLARLLYDDQATLFGTVIILFAVIFFGINAVDTVQRAVLCVHTRNIFLGLFKLNTLCSNTRS